MHNKPLDIVPLWALLLIEIALLWVAMEAGYRLGKWRHAHMPDERDQPVGAMVGSILGLVALVLGFTFSLAASRFDARRTAVLDEANAIGTTYLRARLLPEPERAQTMKLLREYVAVRLTGVQGNKADASIARSEALQELLWTQAATAAAKNEASVMTGVYIQSLNSLIDMHAKRVHVGIRSRIPIVIWLGLSGLSLLGLAAVGYQAGLTTTRRSPAMLALVLAFSIVLMLIADLDRGQEGLLQVGQQAIVDVQRSMQPASESGESR